MGKHQLVKFKPTILHENIYELFQNTNSRQYTSNKMINIRWKCLEQHLNKPNQ